MTSRTSYGVRGVGGHDPREVGRVVRRLLDRCALPGRGRARSERRDDAADDAQRVLVVVGQVVGDAGRAAVQRAAAEVLGRDDLTGSRLHQRRATEEDGALVLDDDGLVGHGRDVGAACGAAAEHGGDLGDALSAHRRLVEEDAAEVLAVGEHLVLRGQEGAARVDEVDAGQAVVQRHLLRPQVLLHRHRVVRAALDGRVVGDDDALASRDAADAGDEPAPGASSSYMPVGRQRRELEEAGCRGRAACRRGHAAAACRGRRGAAGWPPNRRGGRRRGGRAGRRRGRAHRGVALEGFARRVHARAQADLVHATPSARRRRREAG